MRAAKREILRLLSTFVEKCGEPEAPPRLVAESFVPPLLEPVLEDYAQAVPAARDSDALLLLATTIDKLRELARVYGVAELLWPTPAATPAV